tara:strand:- start:54 stop:239 length:186 start_codon:yes stop_codon:yes gene_type:complete
MLLGNNIYVDGTTIQYKGTRFGIFQITYKNEGDQFQKTDSLCQEGFDYQHYMKNEPAPTKY